MSRGDRPIRQQEELPVRSLRRKDQAKRMAAFRAECAAAALRNGLTDLEVCACYAQDAQDLLSHMAETAAELIIRGKT